MQKAWADGAVWEHAVTDTVTLRGRWFDNPGKPVLHFMHGNGFCGGMYWPMLSALSSDYALFLHDAQGHGDSDDGSEFPGFSVTVSRAIAMVEANRDKFGDREIIGIGHSFGAICTLLAAARADNPFQRLVLLDPVFFSKRILRLYRWAKKLRIARFNPLSRQALVRGHTWPDRKAAWAYFYQRGIFKGWPDESLHAYLDHALATQANGSLTLKCPPWMEAAIFSTVPQQLWRAVGEVAVPTTTLYGDKTYSFIEGSLQLATRMNANFKDERVVGGHCFMQEHPAQTAAKVAGLLAKHY